MIDGSPHNLQFVDIILQIAVVVHGWLADGKLHTCTYNELFKTVKINQSSFDVRA